MILSLRLFPNVFGKSDIPLELCLFLSLSLSHHFSFDKSAVSAIYPTHPVSLSFDPHIPQPPMEGGGLGHKVYVKTALKKKKKNATAHPYNVADMRDSEWGREGRRMVPSARLNPNRVWEEL